MRISALLAAAAVSIMLCSCSLIQKLESPAALPFDAIAVAVGVDSIIGTNPATTAARAASVKAIAQQVLAADTGTTATLATLETIASAKILALHLPPGDEAAATLLVATLSAAVGNYVAKLQSSAKANEVQTDVATVLGWVIAECNKYLPATAAEVPPSGFRHSLVANSIYARNPRG